MRAVVVAHRAPDPEGTGDARIAHLAARALEGAGHEVAVVHGGGAWTWRGAARAAAALAGRRPLQLALAADRSLRARVAATLEALSPDVVVAVHARAVEQVPAALRSRCLALIIDSYGRGYRTYRGSVPLPLDLLVRLEARRMERYEAELSRRAGRVAVVSPADAGHLRRISPRPGAVVHIPYAVDVERLGATARSPVRPPELVFTGRLGYVPNRHAAEVLVGDIWPRLRERWPEVRLRLAGARPPRSLVRLCAARGVELSADVADIRHALARAAAALVPVTLGSGVQTKVLEAMAAGVPVVCTPAANEGIAAVPGVHLLLASTPEDFRDQVGRLLGDPVLAGRLAAGARVWVRERHSPAVFSSALVAGCEALAAEAAPSRPPEVSRPSAGAEEGGGGAAGQRPPRRRPAQGGAQL